MSSVRTSFACLALFVAFAGCGGEPAGPTLAPVSGTVKIKGQPAAGVDVNFHGDKAPRAATGRTDANGNYQLTMFKANDGAIPGKNMVTITVPSESVSMDQMMAGKAPPPKITVPPEYSNPTATPFSYEVKAGKNEGANFDVP